MIDQLIAGLSVSIGLLGIALTIVFYVRTVRVKRYMILELWNSASAILHTFDYLDDTKKILHALDITKLDAESSKELLAKVEGARETTKIIWKNLLTHIVIQTPTYDLKMIRRWIKVGRLRGRNLQELEYRVRSALELLSDDNQDSSEHQRLLDELADIDFTHLLVYSKPNTEQLR